MIQATHNRKILLGMYPEYIEEAIKRKGKDYFNIEGCAYSLLAQTIHYCALLLINIYYYSHHFITSHYYSLFFTNSSHSSLLFITIHY